MLLAIDIGNTYSKFCLFKNGTISKKAVFDDELLLHEKKFYKAVSSFRKNKISYIGISSVVPELIKPAFSICLKSFNIKPLIINHKSKLPIKIKVKLPLSLGSDRICNASAGYKIFGGKDNVIVIDSGTAITYDVVLKNGNYTGGAIAPGIHLLNFALNDYTAQLPLLSRNELIFPKNPIGKNTHSALQSGIMLSIADSVNGMINRINQKIGKKCKILVSGGNAELTSSCIEQNNIVYENLVSKGIYEILKYNYDV
jgi:type III pantothenate kinase